METIKECRSTKTKVLADGTVKTYEYKKKYVVKGYAHANGERKGKLTEEQITEIRRKGAERVTIKQLCTEYNVSYATIKKLLPDPKKK
jgi:DNA invertase Pin-like site-specific DNA recombinase